MNKDQIFRPYGECVNFWVIAVLDANYVIARPCGLEPGDDSQDRKIRV